MGFRLIVILWKCTFILLAQKEHESNNDLNNTFRSNQWYFFLPAMHRCEAWGLICNPGCLSFHKRKMFLIIKTSLLHHQSLTHYFLPCIVSETKKISESTFCACPLNNVSRLFVKLAFSFQLVLLQICLLLLLSCIFLIRHELKFIFLSCYPSFIC